MAHEQEVDPIDAMDLSDAVAQAEPETSAEIPDEMVLGSQQSAAPDVADDETPEEAAARDEKGRFAKKEGDDTAAVQQAIDKAAKTGETTTVERETPFQYRAMGANHKLDGASLDKDGNLIVKDEQVGLIREALNALHARDAGEEGVHTFIEKRDQKITELGGQVEDLKVLGQTAEAIISSVERVVKEPDDEKALQAFWQLRSGWDALMARAENQYLNSQLQRVRSTQPARASDARGAPVDEEASAAAMPSREDAIATTVEYIENAKLTGHFKGLTEQDWKQLETRTQRTPFLFLRQATAEDLKDPKNRGLTMGQIVFDRDAFHDHLTDLTQLKLADGKKTKLAADNARRTQASISAPPTPGGGRQAVGAGKKSGQFQTEKDVDSWLDSDEI